MIFLISHLVRECSYNTLKHTNMFLFLDNNMVAIHDINISRLMNLRGVAWYP